MVKQFKNLNLASASTLVSVYSFATVSSFVKVRSLAKHSSFATLSALAKLNSFATVSSFAKLRSLASVCRLACVIFLISVCAPVLAQEISAGKRVATFNIEAGNPAIQGFDPVSYFLEKKAVKGKPGFTYSYQGVLYRLSSAENMATFKQAPGKYEPQYGGWCAFAMGSDGTKVEIDPETFRIYEGKLYLFYNRFFNNTLKTWLKTEPDLKKKADVNWSKFLAP